MAVLGLFASGPGNSAPGFSAPLASQFLAGLRLDRVVEDLPPEASLAQELAVATTETVPPPVEAVPATTPVPTTVAAPPAAAPIVDRPIVAPPVFPKTRTTAPRPTRTAYAGGPKDGGVWAVIVGIDDYPGDDADLKAAVADARDVDSALAAYGVPANRRMVLLDRQATGDNIRGALTWMANRASADSTTVFFYSGHVRTVAGDPDRDGEVIDEAMVGSDGDNIYDGQLADILRQSDARATWIGIAACYGAGFDDALAPGRVLTAAAGENDVAYENSSLGHSYLVEYMVRRAMLQGRAPGSVQEAFAWARAQIARDYPNRQPAILDRSRGPMVLGRAAAAPPASPERKPSPQPAPAKPEEPKPAPPPAAPEPKPDGPACAQVLGVSVCSDQKSSGPLLRISFGLEAEPRVD